jgi:CRISPR-associated endonuclease Csn1
MQKVLGIDLGTNSIGWAIREINSSENQIKHKGVLTYDKGVGEEKGIEVPLVLKRTEARSKRRNYQAKKYRKWELLKVLIQNDPKMCPLTINELDKWRKYKKGEKIAYPNNTEFNNWLKLDFNSDGTVDFENPYQLRKEVAEKKYNNPLLIGRVFYNLVQRRGFRGRDEEESKTILNGSPELGNVGADAIHQIMKDQNLTLGSALYFDSKNNGKRIRKRYSLRTDYESELKTICTRQGIDENSDLFKKLEKAIIWQRPLRTQKGNVGRCTLEPSKPRCPVSHPVYEEYRAWCFINNIKISWKNEQESKPEPLCFEQKQLIFEKLFFRKSKPQFKFSDIMKLLDQKRTLYNFNYKDDATVTGCPVSAGMIDIFECQLDQIKIEHSSNPKRNSEKTYYDFQDIWHVLFSFDSKEKLIQFAKEKLRLDDKKADKFTKIRIQQGYASLSINAINKILPLLKKGFLYSEAVYFANLSWVIGRELSEVETTAFIEGIRKLLKDHKKEKEEITIVNSLINEYLNSPNNEKHGNFHDYVLLKNDIKKIDNKIVEYYGPNSWGKLNPEDQKVIYNSIKNKYLSFMQSPRIKDKDLIYSKISRFDERLDCYLIENWDVSDKKLKHIYHPSEIENYPHAVEINGNKHLGSPIPVSNGFKNPMAMKTLFHLKNLLNYLIDHSKIDEDTRVVVEIARELNDANRRKAIEKWQKDREKENQTFLQEINESIGLLKINIDPSKNEIIDKYRLWKEQNMQCIYTGKIISCTDLFDGTKFDFEHTIPADLSFNNELNNLTICDSAYNRQIKQKRIPTELPNYENEAKIGGITYPAIEPNLKFIKDKVEHFYKLVDNWRGQSGKASAKDRKDYCIQQKHYNQFELEYWKKKLDTFTIKEYKSGWRNSQLRDTQIVTKYALPYLKTFFNRVDVQKGSITDAFKKIYKIGFEKDRSKHIHHAIDAATLTLIPTSSFRDKLLKEHYEALENETSFHSSPKDWSGFNPEFIKNIDETTLINFLNQDRTLVPVKKAVRKRGRIQFVKEKLTDGKWQYKKDKNGEKIPLVATGDSIRGQLHKETFYGAINDKSIGTDGKIIFVVKQGIKDFTSENEFKDIVDPVLRKVITETVAKRMGNGRSFKEAIAEEIWMVDKNGKSAKKDKNGNLISPIRHVRCKVKAGRGFLTKAIKIKEHVELSKQDYKQFYYAQNETNYLYLLYEFRKDDSLKRTHRIINLFDLVELGIKSPAGLYSSSNFALLEKGRGDNKIIFSLNAIIKVGIRVLVWKEHPEELRDLPKIGLLKRLYKIYKFNDINGTGYLYLQFHNEARADKELGEGEKTLNSDIYQPRLRFSADNFNCLIEGKDFIITLDGEINLK